jgi:nucleoid-associated protein YgaU
MWPEIWHVNPQIANPHLIYPGDVVRLIYLDGQPRLNVDRSNRVVKLSPTARVVEHNEAISAIPLDEINNFLSRSRIVTAEYLYLAPLVLAVDYKRLVVGKGDRLYARGEFDPSISVYGVYRKGEVYKDPVTNEMLGIQAMDIASGKMRALEGDVATLLMTRTTEEVRVGDRLLVEEGRSIDSSFFPSAPTVDVDATIIAVEGGVSQVGKMDVVVINRGQRESMAVGNVLAVYKRGDKVKDRVKGDMVTLPDERAGLVMIFRTFEKLSLGLVLEAERPLAIKDLVRNP